MRRADNLTIVMCQLSINLGASTSWHPKCLSRPVMGLLYLAFTIVIDNDYKTTVPESSLVSDSL